MRKRKKRTSGSSACRLAVALTLAAGGFLSAGAAPKGKKVETFAVIAGTVFRESGFSLPGAELTIDLAPGQQTPPKFKRIKAVADARGEFAIRVPALPVRYTVSVRAAGYRPESKEASVQGEERVELFFRLEPESR